MNTFTTTAYNTLGEAQETETQTDSWAATETCLDLSMLYGYAETLDAWGRHCWRVWRQTRSTWTEGLLKPCSCVRSSAGAGCPPYIKSQGTISL